MKTLKIIRNKIFGLINLLCCDEFYLITFHDAGKKIYEAEYRHSFPVADSDNRAIINCMYEHVNCKLKQKGMDEVLQEAKGILK